MPATIDQLVLPGPELEVAPIDDLKTPIVVRITEVFAHGSSFRYNLSYYGLEPGEYDLVKYLRRKDGKPAEGVEPIKVTVNSVLPPGQIEPHAVKANVAANPGGYRLLMVVGAMLWSAGLVILLYLTRRKPVATKIDPTRPVTLADRLKPLVEGAVAGTLRPGQHAELERLLIGYWRRKLEIEHDDLTRSFLTLREHPEAGPLLVKLEEWLHKPGGAGAVDIPALLRPYNAIPADDPAFGPAVERTPAASGRFS